ncbi:MAG: hypothetical protein KJ879_02110 [Nanoarchaeota archaeon]|nr:hypothetical protein [Nanoarchaeota archaeon]
MAPIIEVSNETLRTLNPKVYTLRTGLANSKGDGSLIHVPSINTDVPRERTHQGKNWYQAHKSLAAEGSRMLTPKEYVEFLKYSKENVPEVYEDATAVRNPWRAEWLDAFFEKGEDGIYILTRNKTEAEKLSEDTLMEDKRISRASWLENPTEQGLPRTDVKEGSLSYWYPRDGAVAWSFANSVRSYFNCDRDPSNRNSDLGVRASKKRE